MVRAGINSCPLSMVSFSGHKNGQTQGFYCYPAAVDFTLFSPFHSIDLSYALQRQLSTSSHSCSVLGCNCSSQNLSPHAYNFPISWAAPTASKGSWLMQLTEVYAPVITAIFHFNYPRRSAYLECLLSDVQWQHSDVGRWPWIIHYSSSYYLRSGTLKVGADMFTCMMEGGHKVKSLWYWDPFLVLYAEGTSLLPRYQSLHLRRVKKSSANKPPICVCPRKK